MKQASYTKRLTSFHNKYISHPRLTQCIYYSRKVNLAWLAWVTYVRRQRLQYKPASGFSGDWIKLNRKNTNQWGWTEGLSSHWSLLSHWPLAPIWCSPWHQVPLQYDWGTGPSHWLRGTPMSCMLRLFTPLFIWVRSILIWNVIVEIFFASPASSSIIIPVMNSDKNGSTTYQ